MILRFSRLPLLWKILLSTSVAFTLLFALTGWIVLTNATRTTSESVDQEVNASFQAYQSLWKSRADLLSSVSLILSTMSDVRAAFGTGDEATIRDTAGELWSRISDADAIFIVTDPRGRVIASLGGAPRPSLPGTLEVVRDAAAQFPKQVSGFLARADRLYHITITPVYVHSTGGLVLLDVLVAGYDVNHRVAAGLKDATGGSEFLFLVNGRVVASTLAPDAARKVAAGLAAGGAKRVNDGRIEYAPLIAPLRDISGARIGELAVLRSFEGALGRIAALRRSIVLLWIVSMGASLALTYLLARKIVQPVRDLDRAATEIALQNYDCRVEVRGEDDLGRLAATFNHMCESIQQAREELIVQERIATIGRLASSIAHDELEQAAEIQRQFLPAVAPVVPGLELAGYNAACRTVGGDYYDFLTYPGGKVGIVIGDVAGKGMAAALLMTSLQAKVQALAEALADPADVVARLNRSLATTCPQNRFITFFFAIVDPHNGEMVFCNAGHNPPLLVRQSGEIVQLEGGGPVLGIFPAIAYHGQRCQMHPGDVLLLYSDGVTEACNPAGEEFEGRLLALAAEARGRSAAEIVQQVHEAVRDWIAGEPPADDITVVCARRTQ
jgi:serine phosphatase RsbU (regulator of sigma subunit)